MRRRKRVKIRKSIRYFYLASSILILVCSSTYLLKFLMSTGETSTKSEEIYSYINKFNYEYKVNLIKNPYTDETTLGMNENVYVTDLIKNIDLDLNYNYTASTKSKIKYEYTIKGLLEATYTKDGDIQKVWEKQYNLVTKEDETLDASNIKIQENLDLNLKEQNNLVKQFEQEMGMNLDAKYIVLVEVRTNTEIENENVENVFSSTISIDLAEKTTKIDGENNREVKKYISKKIEEEKQYNVFGIIISFVLCMASISMIRYIYKKTIPMNRIKNEYRQELNRILRLCQDKIVQVSTPVENKNERIIDVKDFGEIIKVSEELFKPILYWNSKDKDEACFSVVSNNITYRYILKK